MALKHHLLGSTAALGIALVTAGQAYAGGFALREQSTYFQGMAFAGAAAGGPGVSGMFWNPAIGTNVRGWAAVDSSYTLIAPQVKLSGTGNYPGVLVGGPGSSGDIGQDALLPATAASARVWNNVFLGVSISSPFGLVTKPNVGWVGSYDNYSSKVFSLNVTPSVAWKVNDWLSLGAGVQLQYFKTNLKNRLPAAGNPLLGIELDDDVGVGFTAGVQIKPWEGTEIGLGFRSSIEHKLEGTVTLGPAALAGSTTLRTPEVVSFGIKQRVTDSFSMAGTVEWTNWSRLGTLVASGPGAALIPGGALPFNYRDGWYFSLGGEYKFNPAWSARLGAAYEKSPITDADRSTRLPDSDRVWLAAGLSYNYSEKLSIDAGYTYIFATDKANIARRAGPGGAINLFTGTADADVHILSVGLRYRFGDVAPAAGPLVAKY